MNRAILNAALAASLVGACGDSDGTTASGSATASGTGTATTGTTMSTPTSSSSDSQTGSSGGSNSDSDTDSTSDAPTTGSPTTGTTTSDTTTTGTTGAVTVTETSGGTTTGSTTDPDTTTGNLPCGGPGEPDVSYIWIANSSQGTISKINTQTLVEEGRYVTRPGQTGDPSRTSVNLVGDVAVANRNGGLTKVYAQPEKCVESNGMPGIQTSTDSNFLPWGVEECVAWHTPMNYVSQRPVAWTQGTFNEQSCLWENQKVWTSGANDPNWNGTGVDIILVDGATGAIENQKTIPEIVPGYYGIYGAAVDKDGNMWGSQLGIGRLLFVDINTFDHKTWPMPTDGYGMTVGASGYVWTCSWQVGRFDPMSETWQVAAVNGSGGCMEDDNGTLYLSGGLTNIVAIDAETMQVTGTYAVPEYVHGISIDYYGYVWGVSMGSNAYRVDVTNNGAFQTFTGLVGAYTYSDMTGVALANVAPQ